tara:strand:+ start:321893 stop:322057 length:165 start_codon:yes stop_codon:yes gene_type:complete
LGGFDRGADIHALETKVEEGADVFADIAFACDGGLGFFADAFLFWTLKTSAERR